MRNIARRLAYASLALAGLLLLLAWLGDAINWNRIPPYQKVHSWGEKGQQPGQFDDPTGIAVTADEVFVSDARNNRIQVFDKHGRFKHAFGQDRLGRPMNLAIADGRLYVSDYFKDAIFVFDLAGDYQRTIKAADGFNSPGGLTVRRDGTLLVADTYANRIVHLDADGQVLKIWAGNGNGVGNGSGEFSYPTDVTNADDGGFYVADGYNDRIQQFDPNGELVRRWGGPFALNIYGPFKGWFTTVTSMAVQPDGKLLVADFYNDRIQVFSAEGQFLTTFGTPSTHPGHSEIAVAADPDGSLWSVNFSANQIEHWQSHPFLQKFDNH